MVINPFMDKTFSMLGLDNLGAGWGGSMEGTDTNAMEMGSLPFFAKGGPVNQSKPIIVGEKGPELFIPNKSASISGINGKNPEVIGKSGPEIYIPITAGRIVPNNKIDNEFNANPSTLSNLISSSNNTDSSSKVTGNRTQNNKINNNIINNRLDSIIPSNIVSSKINNKIGNKSINSIDNSTTDSGMDLSKLPRFAEGGIASGPSIVGEKGPELFIPNYTGRIVPNDALSGDSNGINVVLNNNFTGVDSVNRAELMRFGSIMQSQITQNVVNTARKGGTFSKQLRGQ
jgi:hypothetical protein